MQDNQVNTENIINELLDQIKKLHFDNAVLKSVLTELSKKNEGVKSDKSSL
jgi:hypothetical protein